MLGKQAAEHFAKVVNGPVLDVGSGHGDQARYLRATGLEVVTLDNKSDADIRGSFMDVELPKYSGIHCCHVLEHQRNVGLFLDKIFATLTDDGYLCITVPPAKAEVVGGHISLWIAGTLVYNLILAGFDCSDAWVRNYDYNVSVVVKKTPMSREVLSKVNMNAGDIALLAPFFPWKGVKQGFFGMDDA